MPMILSQKDFASKSKPAKFFSCDPIIINDVALVKALTTGTLIKSTRKPIKYKYGEGKKKLAQREKKINGNRKNACHWSGMRGKKCA